MRSSDHLLEDPDTAYFSSLTVHALALREPSGRAPSRMNRNLLNSLLRDYWMLSVSADRVFLHPSGNTSLYHYVMTVAMEFHDVFVSHHVDAAVFESPPHMIWDQIAYHVLVSLGVVPKVLRTTQISNRICITDGFSSSEFKAVQTHTPVDLDLREVLESTSPRLELSKAVISRRPGQRIRDDSVNMALEVAALIPTVAQRYVGFRGFGAYAVHTTPRFARSAVAVPNVIAAYTRAMCIRPFARRRLRKSPRAWPDRPYVYLPLHFQPERSTVPEGGTYWDQLSYIAEVAEALPSGWVVVVKDHPRQFQDLASTVKQRHYRSSAFFHALERIPKVATVDPLVDSSALIRRAALVASVSGSSAWEALLMGKPSLTAAVTWHSTCTASPAIVQVDNAGEAIRRLTTLSSEGVLEAVQDFLDEVGPCLITGGISAYHLSANLDLTSAAESMAAALWPESVEDAA